MDGRQGYPAGPTPRTRPLFTSLPWPLVQPPALARCLPAASSDPPSPFLPLGPRACHRLRSERRSELGTLLHGRPLAPFVQVSVRSVTAPERPLLTVTACKTASPPTLSAPSSASVYFVALITPRHHNTCLRVWLLLYVSPARM